MIPPILYVEDDAKSRQVMQLLLVRRMKLPDVTIFEDSTQFLERLQALDPAPGLIFLDIHVTPYSGFEMLAMIRQVEVLKAVPVVALTASVMNEEVQLLRSAGFTGCLAKPIDLETFPQTITQILAGEVLWRIF